MPKNLNYPLASFQKSYALALTVDDLSGSCSVENCAAKMKRKVSGGFMVIISSAQKFNLVSLEKGMITISEDFKGIKYAYTNTERLAALQKAFLSPQVFSILYNRFKGQELPAEMLDKILVREFDVEENAANRVAGYFEEGLKTNGLMAGNQIIALKHPENEEVEHATSDVKTTNELMPSTFSTQKEDNHTPFTDKKTAGFIMEISGEGIYAKITINEAADLAIAEVLIEKIKKSITK